MINLRNDSRYLITLLLIDADGNQYFDNYNEIFLEIVNSAKTYQLAQIDLGRFDIIAQIYYANPNLWWAIPQYNNMEDPFSEVDFSDAIDQPVYPNYQVEGLDALIEYPLDLLPFTTVTGDIFESDIAYYLPGIRVPEYAVGDLLSIAVKDVLTEAISEAQNQAAYIRSQGA